MNYKKYKKKLVNKIFEDNFLKLLLKKKENIIFALQS